MRSEKAVLEDWPVPEQPEPESEDVVGNEKLFAESSGVGGGGGGESAFWVQD